MNRQIKQSVRTGALMLFGALLAPVTAEVIPDNGAISDERQVERATPWLDLLVTYYDSEGHYGMMRYGLPFTGLYLEYQFAGEDVMHLDGSRSLNREANHSVGTPYAFRTFSDQYGSIMGFSRVNSAGDNYARFTVPVPASSLGLTNGPSKQPFGGTPPGGHGTAIGVPDQTFLADRRDVPAVAVPVYLIPDAANRTPTFSAEYLPGNSSASIGQETLSFPTGWFSVDGSWVVVWGYEGNPAPFVVYVSSHLPLGQLRGSLGLTGYSSDSVIWEALDLYEVHWTPLLSTIPGSVDSPSPSEILDLNTLGVLEGAFILEPAIREKLLGQSELFTNLKAASDLNQDGVLDAADFIPLQAAESRQ